VHVRHYADPSAFVALRSEWNSLLRASSANTVFSTWEWQTTWWKHLSVGELWLTAVRDNDGQLIGILPCYRCMSSAGERSIRLVGCVEVADYLDLIIREGQEETVYRAFIEALLSDAAPPWDVVELCNLAEGSPTRTILPEVARVAGLQVNVLEEDVCPIIRLPGTWDAYLDSLDKKQRHEIRRKLRRAEREARLEWHVVDEDHALDEEIDTFLKLHRLSSPDKEDFMDASMTAFFHGIARSMFDAGWLQLMQLKLDGVVEASLLSFDYERTIMLYNSGFDPQGHPELSPGSVLVSLCVQHAIELGRDAFDFLQGDEVYKYRFGAQDTRVYRALIERGT
jgi:CelD/BcsL family acetyltransferase involved in cellulose biosynthesis